MNSSMEEEPVDDVCDSYQKPFLKLYVDPSKTHNRILSELEQKRSVIIHNMPEPGIKAIYSLGILPFLRQDLDFCLVITRLHLCENRIIQTMKHLVDFEDLKVRIDPCGYVAYVDPTESDVAVGLPDDALTLFERQPEVKRKIITVVIDWGNNLLDDNDEKRLLAVVKRVIRELGEVQVVVSVEQKLMDSSLISLKDTLKVKDDFVSPAVLPTKDMILSRRIKHQYIFVEDDSEVTQQICDIIRARRRESMGDNIIIFSGSGYTLEDLCEELPEDYDILVTSTKMNGYMTKEERDMTVKEFLDKTHVLIADATTVSDISSLIANKVNLIISYDGWGHPRHYLKHLYPYEALSSAITFVDEEEVNQVVDIQECFPGVIFTSYGYDYSCNLQKRDVGGKHIVCKMEELEHFFRRLLKRARVTIIFVKDCSEMKMVMKKLKKKGVCIAYWEQYETLMAEHKGVAQSDESSNKEMAQNDESSKPLVYVTIGHEEDCIYFSGKQLKVGMVINYDMSSDVETYCKRVGWCDNREVVIINPTSDVNLPRFLDWQKELGVCFEPFFPPRVLSHLDMACGKTPSYCVQEYDYYYYLKYKKFPLTPELHEIYFKRMDATLKKKKKKKKDVRR